MAEWYDNLTDAVPVKVTSAKKKEGLSTFDFVTGLVNAISQGATFGTADELIGLAAPLMGMERAELTKAIRDNLAQFRAEEPVYAYGSEIASSIATPLGVLKLAPQIGTGIAKGLGMVSPKLATPLGQAATGGAIYGAGASEGTVERLPSAALGAGFGMAGEALAPVASVAAKQLEKSGIPTTVGQMFGGTAKRAEEILTSAPIVGGGVVKRQKQAMEAFPVFMYNKALEPLNIKLPKALSPRGAFEKAKEIFNKKYDEVLSNVEVEISDEFLSDIGTAINKAKFILGEEFKPVGIDLESQILNQITDASVKDGKLTGRSLKKIQSFINSKMTENVKKNNDTVASAYAELDSAIMDSFIKFSPTKKAELDAVNKAYSNFIPLRKVAAREDESLFSPAKALQAVRAEERKLGAVGESRLAAGEGRMQEAIESAKDVIGSRMPDSGTAGRLGGLALLGSGVGLATGTGYMSPEQAIALGGAGLLGRGVYSPLGQKAMKNIAMPLARATMRSPAVAGLLAQSNMIPSAQASDMITIRPEGSQYLLTD